MSGFIDRIESILTESCVHGQYIYADVDELGIDTRGFNNNKFNGIIIWLTKTPLVPGLRLRSQNKFLLDKKRL